jgi:HPt (histidine-containing phosphotransfer) domain-containing protein
MTLASKQAVKDVMTAAATPTATATATAPQAAPTLAAIDVRTLRLYVGDDECALQDFLGRFFARLEGDMDDVHFAIDARCWKDVARLAHQMRSSALAIGATGFAQLCTRLEQSALLSDIDAALARLGELETCFSAVQEAVMEIQHAKS